MLIVRENPMPRHTYLMTQCWVASSLSTAGMTGRMYDGDAMHSRTRLCLGSIRLSEATLSLIFLLLFSLSFSPLVVACYCQITKGLCRIYGLLAWREHQMRRSPYISMAFVQNVSLKFIFFWYGLHVPDFRNFTNGKCTIKLSLHFTEEGT